MSIIGKKFGKCYKKYNEQFLRHNIDSGLATVLATDRKLNYCVTASYYSYSILILQMFICLPEQIPKYLQLWP